MADKKNLTCTYLGEKLPMEISGWKKSGAGAAYRPDNLYKYINGAAELYISYQFKSLAAHAYVKEGFPAIKTDIFDMGDSKNAFGVFSQSREKTDRFVAPDVESEYAAGLLTFWKGRFYVSILAYPETGEKKKLVQHLGRHIAGLIQGESKKPPLTDLLPVENRVPGSVRYFRHHTWINSHYYISDENILRIDKDTEAVSARYDFGAGVKQKGVLLLVTYPDAAKAKAAYAGFLKHHRPGAQDGRRPGRRLKGRLVSLVFNAPDLQHADELLNKVGEADGPTQRKEEP